MFTTIAMYSLAKDSTITFITRGLALAIGMATIIIIARVLGPSLYGSYTIILLTVNVTSLLVLFGFGSANVYYGARNPDELPTLTGNSFAASFGLGLIGIIGVELVTFFPAFKDYLIENGIDVRWVRGLILFLPLVQLKAYLPEILRAAGDIVRYNFVTVCESVTSLFAVVLLVYLLKQGLSGGLYAWIISLIAISSLSTWLARRAAGGPPRIGWHILRRNLSFGIRLYPGNIAQFLNYRFDVFLVAFFWGPVQVSFYIIATSLAEKLWEIPNAIRTVLLYKVASSDANMGKVTTECVIRVITVLVGGMCLMVALISYPLIHWLFGTDYLSSVPALVFLMPGIWTLSIGKLLAVHLTGSGRPEVGTLGAIVSLIVTIVLDLLLIPKFGIVGASIASSISYSLATLVILVVFLRVTGGNLADVILLRREDILVLHQTFNNMLGHRLQNLILKFYN